MGSILLCFCKFPIKILDVSDPDEPLVPELPDVPDDPEVPLDPDVPEEPDVPDEPDVPIPVIYPSYSVSITPILPELS